MRKVLFSHAPVGLVILAVAVCAVPAPAMASVDTSMCRNPLFSQPFLSEGDSNQYMLDARRELR